MGPYSRGTSHTTGAVVEALYDQPLLLLVAVVVCAGLLYWKVMNSDDE